MKVINLKASLFTLLVVLALGHTPAISGPPELLFKDDVLTIRTDRYELDWKKGSMVRLVTFLPQRKALSVSTGTMGTEEMPNGLGSFFGQEEAARKQHGAARSVALTTKFPAQHPPTDASAVSYREIPGGARLTYRGLGDLEGASLVQELTVDGETGDLVIKQSGSSRDPGVFGIGFSLMNLLPDTEFIVPYFGGVKWSKARDAGKVHTIAWARFWSAALVIGEVSGGGTFSVWANDPEMRPKYFHHYNSEKVQGLGFESCEDAPYEDRKTAEACAWRFNTFAGSWMEPAARYKDWMVQAYGITPRENRSARWVNDIALFWPHYIDKEAMASMAKRINPKHVLIHNWGMLEGFNRSLPDYVPRQADYGEKTKLAREYGYHVGGYGSMLLLDAEAHPEMMKEMQLEYLYDGLVGSKPRTNETWLVGVHPGSQKWRAFYTDKMKMLFEKYGVGLLYQDVSGGPVGSAGRVEGKTLAAATVKVEDEIRKNLPEAALMGEFWTEVNACREDFGLTNYLDWFSDDFKQYLSKRSTSHPIVSYLFSDFCLRMAFSRPFGDIKRFHMEENINEVTGAIPYWNTSIDDDSGEARLTLARAGLWGEGFRPYFPVEWEPGVVAYMKNPSDQIVRYVAKGESTFCYRTGSAEKHFAYGRITGEREVALDEPFHINPWVAYSEKGPIGLNPEHWYCAFPGTPGKTPVVITGLPPLATIGGARIADDFVLVQVEGQGEGVVTWSTYKPYLWVDTSGVRLPSSVTSVNVKLPAEFLFVYKEPIRSTDNGLKGMNRYTGQQPDAVTVDTIRLNHEEWRHQVVSHGWVRERVTPKAKTVTLADGTKSEGYIVLPPVGGKDVESSAEAVVRIPQGFVASIKGVAGRIENGPSDGVHFVIRVNGREVWRRFQSDQGYKDFGVPLDAYTGQNILLSLSVDCGTAGNSTSCDWSFWGGLQIEIRSKNGSLSPPKSIKILN